LSVPRGRLHLDGIRSPEVGQWIWPPDDLAVRGAQEWPDGQTIRGAHASVSSWTVDDLAIDAGGAYVLDSALRRRSPLLSLDSLQCEVARQPGIEVIEVPECHARFTGWRSTCFVSWTWWFSRGTCPSTR
jgi:hypothetical protein